MKELLLILIIFLSAFPNVFSQSTCGCDHVITQGGIYYQSTTTGAFNRNVLAGQTVCIMAGNYNLLRFRNFVGSPTQPIVFKNCGGLVTIGHGAYYAALDFQTCRYFRITGSGDPSVNYGFRVDSCGTASAMSVGSLSSDAEVDHIEIAKAGFAGIMVKTDPGCDRLAWRENFSMYNVNVHHNYVHDVGGEGFYIGNSFFGTGMTLTCSGVSTQAFPHNIYNLQIHHNKVRRSGAECLQYACAPAAQVHDNDLDTCGISPFAAFQNNGLQCGGGAGGDCYNNRIANVGASGLAIIGPLGNNRFYNNLLINCGGDGVFCDNRAGSLPNTYCDFINNTIVNSGRDAMRLYNEINSIVLANNVLVGTGRSVSTGTCIVFQQGATATQLNNYCAKIAPTSGMFVDTFNYRPLLGSSLINSGTDVSAYGITFDLQGTARPLGGSFDKGAFEFDPTVLPIDLLYVKGIAEIKGNRLIWAFAHAKDLDTTIVEKSKDGVNFRPLSIKAPVTTSARLTTSARFQTSPTFEAFDDTPFDITYYRLKTMELDGKSSFSKIINVLREGDAMNRVSTGGKLIVYPNPVNDVLTIENVEGKNIEVINVFGQIVMKLSPTINHLSLTINHLKSGVYFVKTSNDMVRFIKN